MINKIIINRAKNDCIDYSGGNYIIKVAHLNRCFDKGLSIGEKSNLNAGEINVTNSRLELQLKILLKLKLINIFQTTSLNVRWFIEKKKNTLVVNYQLRIIIVI